VYHLLRKGNTSRVGCYYRAKSTKVNQNKQWLPNGSLCHVPNSDEMTMKSHVKKPDNNTMGMGVHRIVEKIGKTNPKN